MNDNRIMSYKFNTTGSATLSAVNDSFESEYALNGKLIAIKTHVLNSHANGSILVTHDGDVLYNKNGISNGIIYPRRLIANSVGGGLTNTGSVGNIWTEPVMINKVNIVASGCGPGSSFYCELLYQRA